jgi:hypothetical protein
MTVLSTNVSVTYTGSGTVGPFAFTFSISSPAAMTVYVNNTLQSSSAYTIAPVNNNYDNGGSVTMIAPVPNGQPIKLQRSTPLTQTQVYTDNIPQPLNQWENGLDKLTEIVQEIAANQSGSGSGTTSVTAGTGITVTGTGTLTDPYIISTTGAPLSIASFTPGFAAELGQNVINPSFSATYTGAPTSANITNTDAINSPHALTAPFTSATLVGTFSHSAAATVTFTLHASDGISNPTATVTGTWAERIFGGVGASGATSTVTASGTTAVLSTTDALPSAGLGVETVGELFGPYTPSGQCVYLLLSGGTHTFTDNLTGFPFAFNAPIAVTFVNQYGVSLSMFLYQSVNPLTGTFQPKVTS